MMISNARQPPQPDYGLGAHYHQHPPPYRLITQPMVCRCLTSSSVKTTHLLRHSSEAPVLLVERCAKQATVVLFVLLLVVLLPPPCTKKSMTPPNSCPSTQCHCFCITHLLTALQIIKVWETTMTASMCSMENTPTISYARKTNTKIQFHWWTFVCFVCLRASFRLLASIVGSCGLFVYRWEPSQ